MRFQKITPFIAVVFILALLLSACSAADLVGVNAAGKQANIGSNTSQETSLTLGQTRFSGVVVSIDSDRILVDDLVFRVDDNSNLPNKLSVGDEVNIDALLLPDLSRYVVSLKISSDDSSTDDSPDVEFKLYGEVEGMGDESWVVSGEVIYVDTTTKIEGKINLTDLVEVEGKVVDGKLLAKKISLEDSLPGSETGVTKTPTPVSTMVPGTTETAPAGLEVEFKGILESMSGNIWVVDGKSLTILPQTEIKGQLMVGDLIKVHAWRQLDGSLIAREVEKVGNSNDDDKDDEDEVKGTITSMNGAQWIIGGVVVLLDASTEFEKTFSLGDFVKVEGILQADGSLLAREINFSDDSDDDMNDDSDDDMDDDSDDDMDDDSDDDMDDDSDDDIDDDNDDSNDDSTDDSNDDDDDSTDDDDDDMNDGD